MVFEQGMESDSVNVCLLFIKQNPLYRILKLIELTFQMFDPKLMKKKKKKKTGFDIDAAIAEGGNATNETTENNDKENMDVDATPADDDEALDLESFGKKKKKKKKFNLEELDAALPDKTQVQNYIDCSSRTVEKHPDLEPIKILLL